MVVHVVLVGVEIGSSRSDVLVQGKSFSIKTIIPYLGGTCVCQQSGMF